MSKNEHDNIGPGSYNPQLPSSKFYPSFSFGYKFSNEIENKNPGPGTYTKEEVNLSLTEGDSKNETLPKINSENQLKSQKTLKTENATPKNKKKKLASKKNLGFSTSNRDDLYNKSYKAIPGPGSYDANYKASKGDSPSYKYFDFN